MTEVTKEFENIYAAGKRQVVRFEHNGIPVFVVPQDMKVESLEDLVDKRAERPQRLKQNVELLSAESFIEYFNRFASDHSTIFVNMKEASLVAVLDYHEGPELPAWRLHTARYNCPQTKEWGAWLEGNNQKMDQETFALFIEDNLNEIMDPNGAQMLEIAASLKAKKDVEFDSGIRLDNGQAQFTYRETINGQAGVAGQLSIPEKIKLAISPFQFGAAYECEARFRYRVGRQGLTMWYTLIRPHLIHQDAVAGVYELVQAGMEKGKIIQAKYY